MSNYSIAYSGYASTNERVEAESPESAIEMAEPYVSLCHQCSRATDIDDDWEPIEVIDLDTGAVVWSAPTASAQAVDYLDKLAKARNVIEQVRELAQQISVRGSLYGVSNRNGINVGHDFLRILDDGPSSNGGL